MKGLEKLRILAPDIGDDFVGVRRHEAGGVHEHAMQLRRIGETIPIALLDLPRRVGVQEKVASRGAPRQREGGAPFDDPRSGHAVHRSESHAEFRAV